MLFLCRWIFIDWSPKEQWRRTSLRGQRRRWFWTISSFRGWTLLVELYWTATRETQSKTSEMSFFLFNIETLKLVFIFTSVQTHSIKKNWLPSSSLVQRSFSKRQKEKSQNHRYNNNCLMCFTNACYISAKIIPRLFVSVGNGYWGDPKVGWNTRKWPGLKCYGWTSIPV